MILSLIEFLNLIVTAKDLKEILDNFKSVEIASLYTKIMKERIDFEARNFSDQVFFEEELFLAKLPQNNIDFYELPVTPANLSEQIAGTVLLILQDETILYGAEFDKYRLEAIIESVHEIYPKRLINALPIQTLDLRLQELQRIVRDNPQINELRSLLEEQSQTVDSFVSSLDRVHATNSVQQQILRQIQEGIGTQLSLISSPTTLDSPPNEPRYFLEREHVVADIYSKLQTVQVLNITGGPGKGKSQLAKSLMRSSHYSSHHWVSLLGKNGERAGQHIRDQIAAWASQKISVSNELWLSYKIGLQSFDAVLQQLVSTTMNPSILIIDNLPDPTIPDNDIVYSELFNIVKNACKSHLQIITTSQYLISNSIQFDADSSAENFTPPPFSVDEVHQMLVARGFKFTKQVEEVITANTKGLPVLVAATLNWLENEEEDFDLSKLMKLISDEPVKSLRENYRQRLTHLLSPNARELLYRLSLTMSSFPRDVVYKIAQLQPTVLYPQECLDQVIGIWLDEININELIINPLIKEIGVNNLGPVIQQNVHKCIADYYLQKRVVEAKNVFTISMHLLKSNDHQKYISFLMQFMFSVETVSQAKYFDWTTVIFSPEVGWQELDIDLSSKIIFRSLQIRLRLMIGEEVETYEKDLENLIELAEADDMVAVFFAYSNMTSPSYSEYLTIEQALKKALATIHTVRQSELLIDLSDQSLPGNIENLFWIQVPRIDTVDHIYYLIDLLENIPTDDRNALLQADLAIQTLSILLDKLWIEESQKAKADQQVELILEVHDRFIEFASATDFQFLEAIQARSRAIIVAEHEGQRESAIQLIEKFLPQENPELDFMLKYAAACILFDGAMYEDATQYFVAASIIPREYYLHYELNLKRLTALTFAHREEYLSAKKYLLQAIRMKNNFESSLKLLEMLGELAWIQWNLGNRRKSFSALRKMASVLIEFQDGDARHYQELFNKTVHAVGWFSQITRFNSAPEFVESGETYIPPSTGFFTNRSEKLGDYASRFGLSKAILLGNLRIMAVGLQMYQIAWNITQELQWLNKAQNPDPMFFAIEAMEYKTIPALAAIFGSPKDIIDTSIVSLKTMAMIQYINANSDNILTSISRVKSLNRMWAESSPSVRSKREANLHYCTFIPLMFSILNGSIMESDQLATLDSVENEIKQRSDELQNTDMWIELLNDYRLMINALWDESVELNFDDSPRQALWLFVKSLRPKMLLGDSFSHQISCVNYMIDARHVIPIEVIAQIIKKILIEFWLNVAINRRFAVRSPDTFSERLKTISSSRDPQLSEIFDAVSRALGITIPPDIKGKFASINVKLPS